MLIDLGLSAEMQIRFRHALNEGLPIDPSLPSVGVWVIYILGEL